MSRPNVTEPAPPASHSIAYRHELGRKTIHLFSAIAPLLYAFMSRELALAIAIPICAVIVGCDIVRLTNAPFRRLYDRVLGKVMRAHECDRLCGASYVMISVVLCIALFAKPIAIAALLFMSVSDALASLVGVAVGGPKWMGKTLAGSGTFLFSALIIGLLLIRQPLATIVAALVATVVEALPPRVRGVRLDDNLLVPLAGGAALTILSKLPV